MSNNQKFQNDVIMVGELKELTVKPYTTKNGKNMTNIIAKISVKENDKINAYTVNYMFMTDSEFYQKNANNMFALKTAAKDGVGDLVRISGEMRKSEYCKSGEDAITSIPQYSGKGCIYKAKNEDETHMMGVVLEAVIANVENEIKDAMPTGRKSIRLLTVGYAEHIVYEFNTFVEKDLAEAFTQIYSIGDVAKLHLKPYNATIVQKTENQSTLGSVAFGQLLPTTYTTNAFYNDIIIIGGEPANMNKKYNQEQIAQLDKYLAENRDKILEASKQKSFGNTTTQQTNPFGTMNQPQSNPFGGASNNGFSGGVFGVNVNNNAGGFSYLNN